MFVILIGVRVTPRSEAEDICDDASVKKADQRGTESATSPRATIDQRGEIL